MSQATLAPPRALPKIPFATDRCLAVAELILGVGLAEFDLWVLRDSAPIWARAAAYAALVAVILNSRARRRGIAPEAPRAGMRRAWAEAAIVTSALLAALLLAARATCGAEEGFSSPFADRDAAEDLEWLGGKFLSAGLQQFALQAFLWPLCLAATRSAAKGTACAAGLFALIHLPSPALAAITFLGGAAWIALYRRSGRIAPLVVSHVLLAGFAHAALPERLNYDMQVGISAYNEMGRFAALRDPAVRREKAILRENRESLRSLSSAAYYESSGGTDAAFLGRLSGDVLGRPPAEGEAGRWREALADLGRVRLVADLMTHPDSRFARR
jgi:membrane protease YdiL (CAAX protease family)